MPAGATPVSSVQGSGPRSPMLGQTVTVSAIVTGDFQDNDSDSTSDLGGFFVQQQTPDNDPATSDGVFVFDGDNPTVDVAVSDRIEVTGKVVEHFDETQIHATVVRVTGTGRVRATDVNFPATDTIQNNDDEAIANLEHLEGMLIRFPEKLTASSLRFLELFGEVRLTSGGRAFQFTNSNVPDGPAYAAHKDALAARTVILDDGLRIANPEIIRYLNAGSEPGYSIRNGDSITGVVGNLRFSRGSGGGGNENWRLMPSDNPVFDDDNPRPSAPDIAGSVRVSSFNVLNFFSSIDTGQSSCGPERDQNCRGADSELELDRQLQKITTALQMMNADIIGLVELENDNSSSISTIVDSLNDRIGDGNYDFVNTGTIHDDAIKTGFIYNAATMRPSGAFALLTSSVDARFDDNRNRPALAQTFTAIDSDGKLTVVVNHLKSKGSSCEPEGDPNTGDGQGNCNLTRSNAAAALADWVSTDPTSSGDDDFLIIGDLNAYLMEDPLSEFKNAGFINLLERNPDPYSFVFDAAAGALDHALATEGLAAQVVDAIEWHINADEPPLRDYNLENERNVALFDGNSPYRASDHDPVIIGLQLIN